MPKSRRNKVIALTKTDKKGREHKGELINLVRECADQFTYVWVFKVEHMRNNLLKEVRTAWTGSRILLGRNAVMRKALGTNEEDECRAGTRHIAKLLTGDVGLLFTDEEPKVVTDWFESFKKDDFARTGNIVTESFEIPSGPIKIDDGVAPHSLEPQFRKLGMHTSLVKGVPTLTAPHRVCKPGDTLNSNQVQLLKLFLKPMATFQVFPQMGVRLTDGDICFKLDESADAADAEMQDDADESD